VAQARQPSKIRLLKGVALYPIFILGVVLVMNTMGFAYYVTHVGHHLLEVFSRQNSKELAEGQVLEVANRLYGSLVEGEWSCIKVTRHGHPFLDERRDANCEQGLLGSWSSIDRRDRGGIEVKVLFTPSDEQMFWFRLVSAIEVVLLLGYTVLVGGVQRRAERQAFELETTKLREQAAIAKAMQTLAHDVRKPLHLIRTIASLVADLSGRDAKEVLEQTLPEVEQAIVSVDGMVEDVLSANHEIQLVRSDVTLGELVALVTPPIRSLFGARADDISLDESSRARVINVDVRRMARVLSNILVNACEATGEQDRIWISAHCKGSQVAITIGNSGSYIAPDQCLRIFDEFFTSGKATGTGLGMAIAKRIVEAHGGEISCSSVWEQDEGVPMSSAVTTFIIVV
jgi:signal transduction histidine kinase